MEVSGKTTVVKWDRSIGYTFSSKTILARLMHLFKDSKHISFSRIQKEIKEWTDLDDNKIFERIEGQKINKYINENCKFNLTFKKNLNSVELISSKKKK
jgi:hypothetical protein